MSIVDNLFCPQEQGIVTVNPIVARLRRQRMHMVTTQQQYDYIYTGACRGIDCVVCSYLALPNIPSSQHVRKDSFSICGHSRRYGSLIP